MLCVYSNAAQNSAKMIDSMTLPRCGALLTYGRAFVVMICPFLGCGRTTGLWDQKVWGLKLLQQGSEAHLAVIQGMVLRE